MYTILVTQDNELVTSVKERVMQRSKLVDNLHFLLDPMYKEIDMNDFVVMMEYILPISKEYKSEILIKSDGLYKEKLEFKLPFDTSLTKEAGDIEVQLTFTKVDLDTKGNNVQYVRKTSPTTITIIPISAWSDIIPDSALNAIDQRIVKTQAQIKALEELNNVIATTKADNIVLDEETHELYLTSSGTAIGNRIDMDTLGNAIVDNSQDGLVTMII
jgi:hypothetical protein